MEATLRAIYRYPVKGLSPEALAKVRLSVGQTLPGDRRFAIENGPSGFSPAAPSYLPKTQFLMLMRNESLARLTTRLEEPGDRLVITLGGRDAVSADLRTGDGRATVEEFFATFCADELRGRPRVLSAHGHSFSDVSRKVVSIINLGSVAAIENTIGGAVDPLRFRGNIHISGWPAWHEFDLVGQSIAIGPNARLKIVKRIVRCAATDVDPTTGIRDLSIPQTLMRVFGHGDCGVYGEVIAGGDIAIGDRMTADV